ncbi:MAG: cysteine hydrolase [Chloroflexi bacterium]|nr:cysteine hydrolase [Chloroflexota bacterium]
MKALIVIDMQKALFEKKQKIYKEQELLENTNLLIKKAVAAGARVFVVQHCSDTVLKENTEGWKIHPLLKLPKKHVRILKRHGSCFEDTDLEQPLARNGEKDLVLCGLVTHGCVRASCLDGLARGYRITLVADRHSSYSKDAKALIEKWNSEISSAGAKLQNARQIRFA